MQGTGTGNADAHTRNPCHAVSIEIRGTGIIDLRGHAHNVGAMVGRSIQLLDAYGAGVMRAAVDEMVARGTHDIGALAILCEQHRAGPAAPRPIILDLGSHVVERDVVPHDLGGYDE